jgi:hypothetical protein
MSCVPYSSAVGASCMCICLDISQVVSVVSLHGDPGKVHWQAVKWILRYLFTGYYKCWFNL